MKRILLSASHPSGDRGERVTPYQLGDISLAAASVIEGVLRAGAVIVFGGHPTISPLALQIANLLGAGDRIEIFQSREFQGQITAEVKRLVKIEHAKRHWTPKGPDLAGSLAILRDKMCSSGLHGAFFVGGMEGITEEYDLFRSLNPDAPCFLFTSPGGKAARLVDSFTPSVQAADEPKASEGMGVAPLGERRYALNGRGYAALVLASLDLLELRITDDSPAPGSGNPDARHTGCC